MFRRSNKYISLVQEWQSPKQLRCKRLSDTPENPGVVSPLKGALSERALTMNIKQRFILVESNSRLRAQISYQLTAEGFRVEPYESAKELTQRWPSDGILLVGDNGRELADLFEHMAMCGEGLPLIAYAQNPQLARVVDCIADGAVDYVSLPLDHGKVLALLARTAVRVRTIAGVKLREAKARSRLARLTPRERDVLQGVADGLPNRLIGERLSISPRTVEIHRSNMLGKLGAAHTSEAIRIAVEATLTSPAVI